MNNIYFEVRRRQILQWRLLLFPFVVVVAFMCSVFGTREASAMPNWMPIMVDDITIIIPPQFSVPPGNLQPPPICPNATLNWSQFYCGYMTQTQNPNNNYFYSNNPDYSGFIAWIPTYDSTTGILDHLESVSALGTGPNQHKYIYYMPWSTQLQTFYPTWLAAQYGSGAAVYIATFGTSTVPITHYDPTANFEPDSFNVLVLLAEAHISSGLTTWASDYGKGKSIKCLTCVFYQPDAKKAGEIYLIYPKDSSGNRPPPVLISDLTSASQLAVSLGVVYINGSLITLDEATNNAENMADQPEMKRPLLLMYYSADVMSYFTVNNLDAFGPRFADFGSFVNLYASEQGVKVTYYCHSLSGQTCVTTLWSYNTAYIVGVNAAAPAWMETAMFSSLDAMGQLGKDNAATYKCMQGTSDIALILGFSGCAIYSQSYWETTPSWKGTDWFNYYYSSGLYDNILNGGVTSAPHTFQEIDSDPEFWLQVPVQPRPGNPGNTYFDYPWGKQY